MTEVNKTYELVPGIDQKAYMEYARRALANMLRSQGLNEAEVQRSLLGSPQMRLTLI